jgi:hypothetical protein
MISIFSVTNDNKKMTATVTVGISNFAPTPPTRRFRKFKLVCDIASACFYRSVVCNFYLRVRRVKSFTALLCVSVLMFLSTFLNEWKMEMQKAVIRTEQDQDGKICPFRL